MKNQNVNKLNSCYKREQILCGGVGIAFWHKYGILLCWKGGCAYETVTGRSMGRDFRVYGG